MADREERGGPHGGVPGMKGAQGVSGTCCEAGAAEDELARPPAKVLYLTPDLSFSIHLLKDEPQLVKMSGPHIHWLP